MEALDTSWSHSPTYPVNLVDCKIPALFLRRVSQELQAQAARLFCTDGAALVSIIERYAEDPNFRSATCRNGDELEKLLRAPQRRSSRDPISRFVFINAPDSRSNLSISLSMMQRFCTYHQVLPAFMRSVHNFGFREHAQDGVLNTFDSLNTLYGNGFEIAALGRSAKQMQHCYSLRSVEKSSSANAGQWSIRQCSIYHSLDLESAQATWAVIKANGIVRSMLDDIFQPTSQASTMEEKDLQSGLLISMEVHSRLARWSADDWHLYLDSLENELQHTSRPALSRTLGVEERLTLSTRTTALADIGETVGGAERCDGSDSEKLQPASKVRSNSSSYFKPLQAIRTLTFGKRPARITTDEEWVPVTPYQFSFEDLPRTHHLEEKLNETNDVLINNLNVLQAMLSEYEDVVARVIPENVQSRAFVLGHAQFKRIIADAQTMLRTNSGRAESLLRLTASRRALLTNIVNYTAAQADRLLAEKAWSSAVKMERYTEAQQKDMVSMRIITIITLFFLPGTFICVSLYILIASKHPLDLTASALLVQTMLSTQIVTYDDGDNSILNAIISTGELKLFVAISVPLVALVFILWGALLWHDKRQEERAKHKAAQEVMAAI